MNSNIFFDTVEEAIEDIRNGKLVIVADDETRENEGDLVCAAELVTPDIINFMTQFGRGLICLTLDKTFTQKLNLSQMVEHNTESHGCAFTVSIDAEAKFGVTTGISAKDRATTIRVALDEKTVSDDLRRPGHIFPIQARDGGVLERVGQTEASVDLAKLAGLKRAGVICEILNQDGTMARRNDLRKFAKEHNLKFITVAQIIAYRLEHERFIVREAQAKLPTRYGTFDIYGYVNKLDGVEHVALVKNLKDAEENYFMDRGEFTADLSLLAVGIPPSNGCSFETSNVGSYYNCSDGSRYGIFNNASNAQAGEKDMRYVIVFKDYHDNGVSFKAGDIACMSKGNLARQACKSTGGVEYKGIGWDYITISRAW